MMKRLKWVASAAIFALANGSFAADLTTLKTSFIFPEGHWLWQEGGLVLAKEAEKASSGKIKFVAYPAGQLGKQTASIIAAGVAEAGIAVPSYEVDKLPLTSVAELPGMHSSACEGAAKLWNLMKDGGAIYEAELKPLHLHALYVDVLPPYRLFTTKKKIVSLDEVKGLKIRANGAAMDKTARAIGVVPVNVVSPEMYDALSRGTVDGAFYPTFSVKTDHLENVLSYGVQGARLGGTSGIFVISDRVWQKLDNETKQELTKAGEAAQKHLCTWLDDMDAEVRKELVQTHHLQFVRLSDEEVKRWDDAVTAVAKQWEAEMNSNGRPGSAILKAYREAPGSF